MFSIVINHPVFEFYPEESELIEHWKLASKVFKNYQFYHKGITINIRTDFSDIQFKAKKKGHFVGGDVLVVLEYPELKTVKNVKGFENFIALSFSNVLFLCLNISFPGSIHISKIRLNDGYVDDIDHSSLLFESSWSFTEKYDNWPLIERISLSTVVKWYKSLNINLKIVAETNLERCLFSMLYFCHDTYAGFNPSMIVWITQALESFYGINSNEPVIRTLKKRMFLHLGPANQPKKINKLINEYYDYRSTFVHGDMKILKQGSDKFYDTEELNEYFSQLIRLSDFGASIVISSIQKLIKKNSLGISYKENIVYE